MTDSTYQGTAPLAGTARPGVLRAIRARERWARRAGWLWTPPPLPRRSRAIMAVAVALLAALLVAHVLYTTYRRIPNAAAMDATQLWRATQALVAGQSPYAVMNRTDLPYPYRDEFAYPLLAAIPWLPFHGLSVAAFGALFAGLGAFALLLAVALRRQPLLWAAPTWCLWNALYLAQWSPLLTAAAVLPALQVFFACKPNLGLALFLAFPSVWTIVGGIVWSALAFTFVPDWPLQWLADVGRMPYYAAPVTVWQGGGPLLLLALLRWRIPEGRLVAALALLPSNLIFYDQLPLFLAARTHRQGAVLCVGALLAAYLGKQLLVPGDILHLGYQAPVVGLLYLPALAVVLAHPRVAGEPGWLRWMRRAPDYA